LTDRAETGGGNAFRAPTEGWGREETYGVFGEIFQRSVAFDPLTVL